MSEPVNIRSRKTNFRALVIDVDPDFQEDSLNVPEYEFSSNVGPAGNNGPSSQRTHQRVFYGRYKDRGPYGS